MEALLSRASLDIIGAAGVSTDFNSLENEASPLVKALPFGHARASFLYAPSCIFSNMAYATAKGHAHRENFGSTITTAQRGSRSDAGERRRR